MKEKYCLSVQQFSSVYTFKQTNKVGMPFVKLISKLWFQRDGSISLCVEKCLHFGFNSS